MSDKIKKLIVMVLISTGIILISEYLIKSVNSKHFLDTIPITFRHLGLIVVFVIVICLIFNFNRGNKISIYILAGMTFAGIERILQNKIYFATLFEVSGLMILLYIIISGTIIIAMIKRLKNQGVIEK